MDTRAPTAGTTVAGDLPARDELLLLADRTLADYLRHLARYGGAVLEADGLLLFAGAHRQPNPYRNGALRMDDQLSAKDTLIRAERFFSPRRSGYALWTREHGDQDLETLAVERGFRELERLPQLVLRGVPPYVTPGPDIEIRRATDARTREDYLAIIAEAWGMGPMPREIAARVFFDPESLDLPNVAAYVAYRGDVPLSGVMTFVTQGIALACQGGTVRRPVTGPPAPVSDPPIERRSLAQTCLVAALEFSYEKLGARLSLSQTSGRGLPVWMGLGYRPYTSYGRYHVPTARARAR